MSPGVGRPERTTRPGTGTQNTVANGTTESIPTAPASQYRPSGRRSLPLWIVDAGPYCDLGGHAHRGSPGIRDAGCGAGQYRVVTAS
jgi:hypothetical protein